MDALTFVVAPFLLGYFIGGIPFGFILVYAIKGVDVTVDARTYNSMLYGCRCDRGARFPYISEIAWW